MTILSSELQKEMIIKYLAALSEGDRRKILSLFLPDAVVHSPLYGLMKAKDFYSELFKDTAQSQISLQGVFTDMERPDRAAAHFYYHWELSSGSKTSFECVDLFQFDRESNRIMELRIIYDTLKTREDFNEIRGKG
ncbi:nuclear transport factor 2 family protein [Thermodesulfobacteriota bacterium]